MSLSRSARHYVSSHHPTPACDRASRASDSPYQEDFDRESTPDHFSDKNYVPDSDRSSRRSCDSSRWRSCLRPKLEVPYYYSSDSDPEDEPDHKVTREYQDDHSIMDEENPEDPTPPHSPDVTGHTPEATQLPDLLDMDREVLSQPLNSDNQLVDEFNSEDDEDHLIILRRQPPILDRLVPPEGLATPQEPARRYNLRH